MYRAICRYMSQKISWNCTEMYKNIAYLKWPIDESESYGNFDEFDLSCDLTYVLGIGFFIIFRFCSGIRRRRRYSRSIMFIRRQVEQSAEEEEQQYPGSNTWTMKSMICYEDCAVLSLNAAHAFSSIIHAGSQMRFLLCIFHVILVQNYSPFRTCCKLGYHIFSSLSIDSVPSVSKYM